MIALIRKYKEITCCSNWLKYLDLFHNYLNSLNYESKALYNMQKVPICMPIFYDVYNVHYIKIFLFMYFFYLFGLNSVLWKFLRFYFDWKFDIFPQLNTWKQQVLGFACIQGGKTSKFKSRKYQWKFTFSPFYGHASIPINLTFFRVIDILADNFL